MTTQHDDLEAVRQVAAALEPFNSADRERILRWVREKLGMLVDVAIPQVGGPLPTQPPQPSADSNAAQSAAGTTDIRSFIQAKKPGTGNYLVAAVAYYHRFLAPPDQRKDTIGKDDVLEACRLADVKRPSVVSQALVNAAGAGFVDRAGRAAYRINAVGENLVAMVLPETHERNHAPIAKRTRPADGSTKRRARGNRGSR